MEFPAGSRVTSLTQEVRLATTMTGGVSLAIWMGGVAREINLLSQASQWRRVGGRLPSQSAQAGDTGQSDGSMASIALYAKLLELLDLVVEVDVLSGTSAGGINAAFLASARVTGSDLGRLRELWLDLGSLLDLLREPTDKSTPSLLYGDERMFAALASQIPKLPRGPFPPAGDSPSTTLYVTTTLLTGETSRFTDSFGTLVQDVDQRGLFTFTETELATESVAAALALAARSSASFPAAFEPSFIPFDDETPKTRTVPARPGMAQYANITRPHWVADGGLLDNQPIDVLLKRIFDRRARRSVRRVLLFILPSAGESPDLVKEAPLDDVNSPLGLVDGLLKDLTAVTTQSIAADLRAIRTHQDDMEARTDTRLRLAELAARLPAGSRLLDEAVLRDYVEREATHQTRDLVSAFLRQLSTWPPASASHSSSESLPQAWEKDLGTGGDAERICRESATTSIQSAWPQATDRLPSTSADFAQYGQAAYDLAKGCALAVARAASPLIRDSSDAEALSSLINDIHAACERPDRPDLPSLVRSVCAIPANRIAPLREAAQTLAAEWLNRTAVSPDAWDRLGDVFVSHRETLQLLAASAAGGAVPEHAAGSDIEHRRRAGRDLTTHLDYLTASPDTHGEGNSEQEHSVAVRLFDLAVTLRAMLPVDPDPEQSVELVQVSADTRSLLAPSRQTAQSKLTGMQFHHFGAFYKRSWRANDWMWGRLDGAGWLVHVLLDPRRVQMIVRLRAHERSSAQTGADWVLGQLKALGAPDFPPGGFPLPSPGDPGAILTEEAVRHELGFLDDPTTEMPASLPQTSLWLMQEWQQKVLDEEMGVLAESVTDTQPGMPADWSPATSRQWALKVQRASQQEKYALLDENPVADETFASDKSSPLMARTVSKAAATAAGAAGSISQLPGVAKPPISTLRTLTLGGYRVVTLTKGVARLSIIAGAVMLVLGVAAAVQSATLFGVTGLILAAVGSYLIALGTWQFSSRLLFALLSVTVVGAVLALTTPVVREWLFGSEKAPGLVGTNAYWFGLEWWHPLLVLGALLLVVAAFSSAKPRR